MFDGHEMSCRQPMTHSDPHPHPSGLIRAVDNLGRMRGASATPAQNKILSPTPNRGFLPQIEEMNKTSQALENRSNTSNSVRSSFSAKDQGITTRNVSSSSNRSFQSQVHTKGDNRLIYQSHPHLQESGQPSTVQPVSFTDYR